MHGRAHHIGPCGAFVRSQTPDACFKYIPAHKAADPLNAMHNIHPMPGGPADWRACRGDREVNACILSKSLTPYRGNRIRMFKDGGRKVGT